MYNFTVSLKSRGCYYYSNLISLVPRPSPSCHARSPGQKHREGRVRMHTYCMLVIVSHTYCMLVRVSHMYCMLVRVSHTYCMLVIVSHTYCMLVRVSHTYCMLVIVSHTYCMLVRVSTHECERIGCSLITRPPPFTCHSQGEGPGMRLHLICIHA